MRKQNSEANKLFLRLCAALCVCLLCKGLLYPAPGYADEPEPTPRMIRRPARSPEPDPAEGLPVFVMVYYVNERGTVVREEKRRLMESCLVEAAPEELPEDYELADSPAVYVLAENGTASPAYVEFSVRKKAQLVPVLTGTPAAPLFLPVYYVTENGAVLLKAEYLLSASGAVRAEPEAVPEGFELSGETAVEVRLENGIASPSFVQFTVRRKMTPSPSPSPSPSPTPIPTQTPIPLSDFRTVGNIVRFGHYEQDSNTANGPEEIEWIVLAVQGNKALLLSRYGLDTKPYNAKHTGVTWENCTLRTWLNGDFIQKAFTADEQRIILTTAVDNSKSQCYSGWWNSNGGNHTQDKVYLLSFAEANQYFGVTREARNNIKSRVMPTKYAIRNGAHTNKSNKTTDGTAAGWWWLRSPGYYQELAAYVLPDGSLGSRDSSSIGGAVRPALWIDLNSGIF